MSSSPVCTCGVCPAHGPAGDGADHPGGRAGWAGPVRRYLESVVEWLDGPEAMGAGHGELEARLQVHSREQYRLLLQGHLDERARLELRRSGVLQEQCDCTWSPMYSTPVRPYLSDSLERQG